MNVDPAGCSKIELFLEAHTRLGSLDLTHGGLRDGGVVGPVGDHHHGDACQYMFRGEPVGASKLNNVRAMAEIEDRGRPQHVAERGLSKDRGRDAHYWAPPAQNRTGPIKASGSHLGYLTAKRTACRTRSSPWDAPCRLGVRGVPFCSAFSSAPALGSTGSSAGRPASFVRFTATMAK